MYMKVKRMSNAGELASYWGYEGWLDENSDSISQI